MGVLYLGDICTAFEVLVETWSYTYEGAVEFISEYETVPPPDPSSKDYFPNAVYFTDDSYVVLYESPFKVIAKHKYTIAQEVRDALKGMNEDEISDYFSEHSFDVTYPPNQNEYDTKMYFSDYSYLDIEYYEPPKISAGPWGERLSQVHKEIYIMRELEAGKIPNIWDWR